MSEATRRVRGLANMVRDAVEHGSTAIQRVHLATAARPFRVLEAVPGVQEPARVAHTVYDAVVSLTYTNVRLVNKAVGFGIDLALDQAEKRELEKRELEKRELEKGEREKGEREKHAPPPEWPPTQ